jgi:hypothetical protein
MSAQQDYKKGPEKNIVPGKEFAGDGSASPSLVRG